MLKSEANMTFMAKPHTHTHTKTSNKFVVNITEQHLTKRLVNRIQNHPKRVMNYNQKVFTPNTQG